MDNIEGDTYNSRYSIWSIKKAWKKLTVKTVKAKDIILM
jgi:hypothetical protein